MHTLGHPIHLYSPSCFDSSLTDTAVCANCLVRLGSSSSSYSDPSSSATVSLWPPSSTVLSPPSPSDALPLVPLLPLRFLPGPLPTTSSRSK